MLRGWAFTVMYEPDEATPHSESLIEGPDTIIFLRNYGSKTMAVPNTGTYFRNKKVSGPSGNSIPMTSPI